MRELTLQVTSRMSLRSSGLGESGRTSSPRVLSGSRARRSSLFLFPRRGVRNDRAFHRARGAMCREAHGNRVLEAHGKQQPRKQQYACVPHAVDFAACCITDRELSLAPTPPGPRELSTGMHLDRPPVASASLSCPTADPRLSSVIRRHSGPTSQRPPHPAPRFDDDRDAPLTGAGRQTTILSYRPGQEQNTNFSQLFFLRIRNRITGRFRWHRASLRAKRSNPRMPRWLPRS